MISNRLAIELLRNYRNQIRQTGLLGWLQVCKIHSAKTNTI
jgi:hypothetical protein